MKINGYLEDIKKYISDKNIKDGEYCVNVYRTKPGNGCDYIVSVAFIYKDINSFAAKVEKDISDIDSGFGIRFELWIFD